MDLVFSQHVCGLILRPKAPVEPASIFSVNGLRIHLLVFVCDLINRSLSVLNHIIEELDRFFVLLQSPVKIIPAEHIHKLGDLIKHIGLFPGTAVSVSSIPGNCLHVFHKVFFCVNRGDARLIHDFLIYPECQIAGIARDADDISFIICYHVFHISLGKIVNDIICHDCIVQPFQPSGIFKG